MSDPVAAHRWRSPLLGEPATVELAQGRLEYFGRGSGPTVVFAHGWLANANLWRAVVDRLASRHTCITLDLPLGSHRLPVAPGADLSPLGCAHLIAGTLETLGLDDVTLVGNDSGGAYSQIATARWPDRVGHLVLNSCETPHDAFPPPPFDGLPALVRHADGVARLRTVLADPSLRMLPAAYGWLIKRPIEAHVLDAYTLPCVRDDQVMHDVRKVILSAASAPVHDAGRRLIASFTRPVLLAWSPEDRVFPVAHAHRYAAELANARVALVDDAYSFTPEDQPERLAALIASLS
jgi:pimeloyl-ACP methyl ester carboxylesterase